MPDVSEIKFAHILVTQTGSAIFETSFGFWGTTRTNLAEKQDSNVSGIIPSISFEIYTYA